jgi:hypothetical protein
MIGDVVIWLFEEFPFGHQHVDKLSDRLVDYSILNNFCKCTDNFIILRSYKTILNIYGNKTFYTQGNT